MNMTYAYLITEKSWNRIHGSANSGISMCSSFCLLEFSKVSKHEPLFLLLSLENVICLFQPV